MKPQTRKDGRSTLEPRPIEIITDFTMHAEGSVLISTGNTKIICTASVEEKVPPFLKGKGTGWISAEYSMLPRATTTRSKRDRGTVGGRTLEIQRLIGRSLRAVVDLSLLGERTVWIDCDVIQADGGTRTASITGGYVAMVAALKNIENRGVIFETFPVKSQVAALSLGIVGGTPYLDLDYSEDSEADVDMNVVMTRDYKIIEIQGTAENKAFSREELNGMLDMVEHGLEKHFEKQNEALSGK